MSLSKHTSFLYVITMDIKAHLGQKVTLQWISVKQNLLTVNVILNQQLMDHYFQLLSLHFVYISLEF